MRHEHQTRASSRLPVLAALGVVLGACDARGPQHYRDPPYPGFHQGYGHSAPSYSQSLESALARGGRGGAPRAENWSQGRFR